MKTILVYTGVLEMISIYTTQPENTYHMIIHAGTTIDMYNNEISHYLDGGRVRVLGAVECRAPDKKIE